MSAYRGSTGQDLQPEWEKKDYQGDYLIPECRGKGELGDPEEYGKIQWRKLRKSFLKRGLREEKPSTQRQEGIDYTKMSFVV